MVDRAKFTRPPKLGREHRVGRDDCRGFDCAYLHHPLDACRIGDGCCGRLHAADSNWDEYDFHTGRGPVEVLYVCDTCGKSREGYR